MTCFLKTNLERTIGGDLSHLMRSVRVANPYQEGTDEYFIWLDQSQLNIPFLILSALELPKEGLCFIHTDTLYLQKIHEAIFGVINKTVHLSEESISNPNESYIRYIKNVSDNSIIININFDEIILYDFWKKYFNKKINLISIIGDNFFGETIIKNLFFNKNIIKKYNCPKMIISEQYPYLKEQDYNKNIVNVQKKAIEKCIAYLPYFLNIKKDKNTLKKVLEKMKDGKTNFIVDNRTIKVNIFNIIKSNYQLFKIILKHLMF